MKNVRLTYVYDALCGWCYGFSPAIQAFVEKYKLDNEVISGGMILGDRVGPIGEVAGYIKTAYKDVEQRTGVKFGKTFLNDTLEKGEATFNSLPPSLALSVFKKYQPENQLAFAADLQKAIYFDGLYPENQEGYGELAASYSIDPIAFTREMRSPEAFETVKKEFSFAQQLEVRGFPSVFVHEEGSQEYHLIAHGYTPLETLEARFEKIV